MGRSCLLVSPPDPPNGALLRTYSAGYGDLVPHAGANAVRLPPLELARIGKILKDAGWTVTLVDLAVATAAEVAECFANRPYDVVVASISLAAFWDDIECAGRLRRLTRAQTLCLRTSISDIQFLSDAMDKVDAAWAGGLADEADLPIYLQTSTGVRRLPSVVGKLDIESLPIPDRSLLKNTAYRFMPLDKLQAQGAVTSVSTSFGCSHPCGYYCPYPAVEGKLFRAYSVEHVMEELKGLAAYGIGKVVFRDAVFTEDPLRIRSLCDWMVDVNLSIQWWCETRIDRTSGELLQRMRAAGCRGIEVGVESGDAKIMRGIAKQGLTRERVEEFAKDAWSAGIAAVFLFMIGLPGESRSSVCDTLELIADLDLVPGCFNVSVASPYPGTPLAAKRKAPMSEATKIGGYIAVAPVGSLTGKDIETASSFSMRLVEATSSRSHRSRQTRNLLNEARSWARSAP